MADTYKLSEERKKLIEAATLSRKRNEITVVCIKNPYDPENTQTVENITTMRTLGEVVSKYYPLMSPDFDIAVSIDGQTYQGELNDLKDTSVDEISSVVFCAVPHGGGGDDKGILGMVAMVVVMVVAVVLQQYYMLPALQAAGFSAGAAGVISTMGAAAIMMVGGMLVNTLLPPPSLDLGGGNDYGGTLADSQTYGFESQPNPTTNGLVGPVLYGTYRITPPIINQFITPGSGNDQRYNGLYGLCIHEIQNARNIYINGEPISYYTGVSVSSRGGTYNQTAIPAFGDVRTERNISRKLSTSWETVRTKGKNVQGLFVGVNAPRILETTPEGEIETVTVPLEVEYRRVGTSAWTPFPSVVRGGSPETVEVDKTRVIFTAGYYT